jgi:hypothetical protein
MNVVLRRLSSPAPLLLAYAAAVALWSVPHLGWGGDDSMYVAHARALVEGWPYGNGHYVFSLESPHIGPPFYPPGTALLLAPVYAWAGWNLKALSLVMIACLCIALGFVYGCLAMAEGAAMALAVTALTALNPYVIHFTTYVLSEFPFMLWLYGSLFLLLLRDRVAVSGPAATGALSASIGLCIYFAYATREVGALLLAAMILRDALQREARWARILPAAGVFLAGLAAQRALLPDTSGFQGIVRREILEVVLHEPTIVARNIYRYAEDGLPQFFPGPRLLGGALSNLVLLAAVYGAIVRVRDAAALAAARAPAAKQGAVALARSVPVDLWFLLAYSALLVSLPLAAGGGGRYLLPILPMLLWNAAAGAPRAAPGWRRPPARWQQGCSWPTSRPVSSRIPSARIRRSRPRGRSRRPRRRPSARWHAASGSATPSYSPARAYWRSIPDAMPRPGPRTRLPAGSSVFWRKRRPITFYWRPGRRTWGNPRTRQRRYRLPARR